MPALRDVPKVPAHKERPQMPSTEWRRRNYRTTCSKTRTNTVASILERSNRKDSALSITPLDSIRRTIARRSGVTDPTVSGGAPSQGGRIENGLFPASHTAEELARIQELSQRNAGGPDSSQATRRRRERDREPGPVRCMVNAWWNRLLGAIFAGLLGLLVGIPALRLRGDYLAIVTLGFGLIVENVIANLPFAGGDGLASGTASSSLYANGLGLSTSLQAKYVWLVLGITVLCIALMCMFIRSKYGRAIEAIRDDEIAAAASGVNTTYYKILTFVISAFFAGLAGGLYATCFSSLTTASFTFTSASIWNSTFIVVIVVLGGMGSMTGSVLAAVAMYLLNYEIKNGAWVSALPGFVQSLFQFPMLIYALVLLVVIIFRPRGILGTYEFSLDRLLFDGRLAGKKKAKARKGGADA